MAETLDVCAVAVVGIAGLLKWWFLVVGWIGSSGDAMRGVLESVAKRRRLGDGYGWLGVK